MKNRILYLLISIFALGVVSAAEVGTASRAEIARMLSRVVSREITGGYQKAEPTTVRIEAVKASRSRVQIYATVGIVLLSVPRGQCAGLARFGARAAAAGVPQGHASKFTPIGREIGELVPLACRNAAQLKQSRSPRQQIVPFTNRSERPLVTPPLGCRDPRRQGLSGRHIALWQSHGRYFDQTENRWKWQRSMLWQTCEDLYTQSYVLPYLVPMLENAGACVMLPRERDVQKFEVLADNDAAGQYAEDGELGDSAVAGFAHLRQVYHTGENPFREGTTRRTRTVAGDATDRAVWRADIPEQGEYAVYVSYESTPESADDAHYTVHHLGGDTAYAVNQTMGGGTWIYLGRFTLRCRGVRRS